MFAKNNQFTNNSHVHHVTPISTCPMKQFMVPLTSAISHDKPTPADIQSTEDLQRILEAHKIFEPEHETKHRQEVLGKLTTLFREWIKSIAITKGITVASAAKLGGLIMTFGSYRLGVHQSGADIDALCVAPRCIERGDYFSHFYPLLKSRPEVTECRAVEGAFVPVIKMYFEGIEVDLLFAKLSLKEIPEDLDLSDDNMLRNLDERCVRSLNGRRVTDAILDLTPNHDVFRLALRAIKLWAKKNGVYSNSLGYFGGVTWAMLVARTCQLYPNAAASTIVQKMFLIFSKWKWPLPMLLTRVENVAELPFPVWDSRINVADRAHLMPIITPAYPQQNSTFNVTLSTRKVIMGELIRALNKTKDIVEGRATWERLFESPDFFARYRHFVMLVVSSEKAEDHGEWCGLVESKTRLLIGNLERSPFVTMAHINPKLFDMKKTDGRTSPNTSVGSSSSSTTSNSIGGSPSTESSPSRNGSTNGENDAAAPCSSMWFIGLEFKTSENMNIDLTEAIQSFVSQVNQFAQKIDVLKVGMTVKPMYVKRKELSKYLDPTILKQKRKLLSPLPSAKNNAKVPASAEDSRNGKTAEKRQSDEESIPTDDDACRPVKQPKCNTLYPLLVPLLNR